MGEEDAARAMIFTSVAEARNLGDPFSLALTLYFTSVAAQILGDTAIATENSTASMRLATEHSLEMPKAWSTLVAGWCAVTNGEHERGLAMIDESFVKMHAIQSLHFFSHHVGLLAEAQMKAGRYADAMKAVEGGIAFAEGNGDRFYCAELYRQRGELFAHPSIGDIERARASFHNAMEVARQQGATLLERKARASLNQLSPSAAGT